MYPIWLLGVMEDVDNTRIIGVIQLLERDLLRIKLRWILQVPNHFTARALLL